MYRFPVGGSAGYSKMVRRIVLDDILARFAGSLPTVELRTGVAANQLLWDNDRVVGLRLIVNGREHEERARIRGGGGWPALLAGPAGPGAEYARIVSPKANFIANYAGTNVEPDMSVRVWDGVGSMGMVMMEDGLVTIGMGVWLTELEEFRAGLRTASSSGCGDTRSTASRSATGRGSRRSAGRWT